MSKDFPDMGWMPCACRSMHITNDRDTHSTVSWSKEQGGRRPPCKKERATIGSKMCSSKYIKTYMYLFVCVCSFKKLMVGYLCLSFGHLLCAHRCPYVPTISAKVPKVFGQSKTGLRG